MQLYGCVSGILTTSISTFTAIHSSFWTSRNPLHPYRIFCAQYRSKEHFWWTSDFQMQIEQSEYAVDAAESELARCDVSELPLACGNMECTFLNIVHKWLYFTCTLALARRACGCCSLSCFIIINTIGVDVVVLINSLWRVTATCEKLNCTLARCIRRR